ncbi:MAG: GlsB/YeaQ/YmgE family stress response membrane protein [Lewinellaceae bacterium]|nr:GlsB/YeaQ/YmgE family stress response membrane protein [Lewinellaceae bacterium]MCB9287508.1 GlsB/YeaQ/YmgE family stress response membrane protein [Lewinellaceae bacterium]
MKLIFWLLIGFAAGALAKMVTPQEEKGGWISSIIIGIVGSFVGRIIAGFAGIASTNFIGSLLIATGGAIIVLFVYHRYLADKLNLPI